MDVKLTATIGTVELSSGYIGQNDPVALAQGHAGEITVTSTLAWSGGGINAGPLASASAGTFNLAAGAAGTAAPTGGGTVSLGSTLKLLGNAATQLGSMFEMQTGTYEILKGCIRATLYSMLTLAPVPKGIKEGEPVDGDILIDDKPPTPNAAGTITVDETSKCIIKRKEGETSTEMAQVVVTGHDTKFFNAGRVEMKDRTQIKLVPKDEMVNGALEEGRVKYMHEDVSADPVTVMEAGCRIVGEKQSSVMI